jgi:voltage-gated potassium channel
VQPGSAGAILVTMNDKALHTGTDPDQEVVGDPSDRLATYIARTERPLDLLALATLWIVVVPPGDFGPQHHASTIALIIRITASFIYGVDMSIRSYLARRHLHYLVTHPLGLASVLFPPVRVILSVRLVRSVFRRGNLRRFLVAASVMVLNGAAIVYLFERHAPKSNIHSFGDALWWSFVTVTTVGYGDYYPVTPQGRITACFIMGIGLLTLAVVTAQVASSFVTQSPGRTPEDPMTEAARPEMSLTEIDRRLARIEELIAGLSGAPESG